MKIVLKTISELLLKGAGNQSCPGALFDCDRIKLLGRALCGHSAGTFLSRNA